MKTVYVTIGNSDNAANRLTQQEWSAFCEETNKLLRKWAAHVHGEWYSLSPAKWQNACWCIEVIDAAVLACRNEMAHLAGHYSQESFAWAECDYAQIVPSNSQFGRRLEEALKAPTVKRERPTRHRFDPGPCM